MQAAMFAELQARKSSNPRRTPGPPPIAAPAAAAPPPPPPSKPYKLTPRSKETCFEYRGDLQSFLFVSENESPSRDFEPYLLNSIIVVPLAPCVYRLCDYTFSKAEPITLQRTLLKLGVLRSLQRELNIVNQWLRARIQRQHNVIEDTELQKTRFMELVSNCGIAQTLSSILLKQAGKAVSGAADCSSIPQVAVEGLDEFLQEIEQRAPALAQARKEIEETKSVSFFPGLGELFCPGSKLVCFPEGLESSPLGVSTVQCWYAEELNQATNTIKRRFVLVMEYIVSVGDELCFVACTDVYPEFHDPNRSIPIKELTHRKLDIQKNVDDLQLFQRLQKRGEFYASTATSNHYLEYYPDSFFPILQGRGFANNAVRPLSKGGRVMVDVKRGMMEGHLPVRSSDGYSDTYKEACKLYESSKRTGIAVPFRSCHLPEFHLSPTTGNSSTHQHKNNTNWVDMESDNDQLWMSWPLLVGFSFTSRVWGKLLLGMPKVTSIEQKRIESPPVSPRRQKFAAQRPSQRKLGGVAVPGLGGKGSSSTCGYIQFQTQAFDQLVLAESKKELIRAVARNASGTGRSKWDDPQDEDADVDEDELDELGIDVVANKGGASIFLLHGPPGCGKTLTAEAISELLEKPLYIVTAGDLGITASEVEKSLGSVLDLCSTWDALVLIDEADLFLEARKSTEIERNALVCVMLRLLEYYNGCLFLSSNRKAGSIDPAIASRITVMLEYPELDAEGRAKIWKNLVELIPQLPLGATSGKYSKYRISFSEDDYTQLANGYEINGRQIKNSIVLARALARERGSLLSMDVLHCAVNAVAGDNLQK